MFTLQSTKYLILPAEDTELVYANVYVDEGLEVFLLFDENEGVVLEHRTAIEYFWATHRKHSRGVDYGRNEVPEFGSGINFGEV